MGLCISSHLLLGEASLMMDEQSIHLWVKLNVIRDQFIINLLFLFFGTMVFWFTLGPWAKHFQVLCHPRSVNTVWIIFLKHMKSCRKLKDTFSAMCLYLAFCPSCPDSSYPFLTIFNILYAFRVNFWIATIWKAYFPLSRWPWYLRFMGGKSREKSYFL